jgi:hypothetical protein
LKLGDARTDSLLAPRFSRRFLASWMYPATPPLLSSHLRFSPS